ncbi:MAG: hypothetical protein K2H01_01885 [Ruminococcus sp.]|nr:hypothetical protein [Ruminococcus sp.]
MENVFESGDRVRLKKCRDIECGHQLTQIDTEDIGVVDNVFGNYIMVDYPFLPVLMEYHSRELELVEKHNPKTAFLRDLKDCLKKHHANINAYHIEDDKLVVDLNWLNGTMTIGESDDIKIDEEWLLKEIESSQKEVSQLKSTE